MMIKSFILCLILTVLGIACNRSSAETGTACTNTTTNVTNIPAAGVTLSWNASSSPRAAGYKVYYGLTNGVYNSSLKVGSNLAVTVSGLTPGVMYYFVVNAYDNKGAESPFSNQVSNRIQIQPSLEPQPLTQTISAGTPVALK
jgi:hypothetical protein